MEYLDVLWAFCMILIMLVLFWYGTIPTNLPPGPLGLPILGCMHRVKTPTAHLTLEEWSKKYGPIYSFYQGTKLVVVLSDYDLMQEALQKQGDVFGGKPIFKIGKGKPPKHGILQAEGARWKEQRRFALSTLRHFGFGRPILEPKIELEVQELLALISNNGETPFDPQPLLSTAVSNVICSMIFGHRFEADSQLKHYLDELNYRISQSQISNLSAVGIWQWLRYFILPFSPKLRRFATGGEDLLHFMQKEIEEARKAYDPHSVQPPECFVHSFDKAAMEQQLEFSDDRQLSALINDLFLAGSDTTMTTLRWSIFYMATHPEIQEQVHQEIAESFGDEEFPNYADRAKLPFIEATLLEIQRSANLLPLSLVHRTTEKAQLMGYTIPQDTWIVNSIWAVHHNPTYFPEPNKFLPSRFLDEKGNLKRDSPLIPFSTGKRICLGESLARMELFIFFAALMQHFQFYFASEKDAAAEVFVGFLRSPRKFMICARKRQN